MIMAHQSTKELINILFQINLKKKVEIRLIF